MSFSQKRILKGTYSASTKLKHTENINNKIRREYSDRVENNAIPIDSYLENNFTVFENHLTASSANSSTYLRAFYLLQSFTNHGSGMLGRLENFKNTKNSKIGNPLSDFWKNHKRSTMSLSV